MMAKLTSDEENLIFSLAERITGCNQQEGSRHDIIVTNVMRRMEACGLASLSRYLSHAVADGLELQHLVSAVTIHTTEWFRERPHFDVLHHHATRFSRANPGKIFSVLSAACSTGQEVWSMGLLLEQVRRLHPGFDYRIHGIDIDPLCVSHASRAIYPQSEMAQIPEEFRSLLLLGSGKSEGLFTLHPEIRSRCSFAPKALQSLKPTDPKHDFVVCRNVLIYFSAEAVERIVRSLADRMTPEAILCLGHSESISGLKLGLKSVGHNCHTRGEKRMRVLVVDDSATIRRFMSDLLSPHAEVLLAESALSATARLAETTVDLITLDLHMPGEDGVSWLHAARARGLRTPVVVVSEASEQEASHVLGALETGAQDYVEKAQLKNHPDEIIKRLKAIASKEPAAKSKETPKSGATLSSRSHGPFQVLLVGASTGGTDALSRLLAKLPADHPPVVVVQHISPAFFRPFAERLAKASGLILGAGQDGEPLERGHIYLALEDVHLGIRKQGDRYFLTTSRAAHENGHRPSVDYLFRSAVPTATQIAAVILTGMGRDGAHGMAELFRAGAQTMAQDESSCVVFGMPREAIAEGGAAFVGDLNQIRERLEKSRRR